MKPADSQDRKYSTCFIDKTPHIKGVIHPLSERLMKEEHKRESPQVRNGWRKRISRAL